MTSEVWVSARSFSTGMTWARLLDQGLRLQDPAPPVARLSPLLSTDSPSFALGRWNGRFVVGVSGFSTGQQRTNAPNTTAQFIVLNDDERHTRALASEIVTTFGAPADRNLAQRISANVVDGPDTMTFAVRQPLPDVESLAPEPGRAEPLPKGRRSLHPGLLTEIGRAIASGAELADNEWAVLITTLDRIPPGEPPAHLVVTTSPTLENDFGAGDPATPTIPGLDNHNHTVPTKDDRLIAPRPGTLRTGQVLFNMFAAVGALATALTSLLMVRTLIDIADAARTAAGFTAPNGGRDWYMIVVLVMIAATGVVVLWRLRRFVNGRYDARLSAVMGAGARPLISHASARHDHDRYLNDLVAQPAWQSRATQWRASGVLGSTNSAGNDALVRLIADDIEARVGQRALGTGLAVAATRSKAGDAFVVVGGSIEIQLDVLASLGVRPTWRTYVRIARSAVVGITAASYLDIEDRMELELAVRAAVLGLDAVGGALETLGETLPDDVGEAMGDVVADLGGGMQTVANVAGGALGVTGTVVRQVAAITETIGTQVTEGLVIASLLHYQGTTLAAEVVAGNDHELRLALSPPPRQVPASLFRVAVEIARRQRKATRIMLQNRVGSATRQAPAVVWNKLRDGVRRRSSAERLPETSGEGGDW